MPTKSVASKTKARRARSKDSRREPKLHSLSGSKILARVDESLGRLNKLFS